MGNDWNDDYWDDDYFDRNCSGGSSGKGSWIALVVGFTVSLFLSIVLFAYLGIGGEVGAILALVLAVILTKPVINVMDRL